RRMQRVHPVRPVDGNGGDGAVGVEMNMWHGNPFCPRCTVLDYYKLQSYSTRNDGEESQA
ncbi:MAG: hypothetical protein ACU0DK_11195, partial [Pseudooceanicola sp.]